MLPHLLHSLAVLRHASVCMQVVEDEFRKNPQAAEMHEGLDGLALGFASPEASDGIPKSPNKGQALPADQNPVKGLLICPPSFTLTLMVHQVVLVRPPEPVIVSKL